MKKLKFPIIRHGLPGPPVLSMDDYYRFVLESQRIFQKEIQEEWKKKHPVSVRFVLKKDG